MRLNIGCGVETIERPGWVNVDAAPAKPHVLKARADELQVPTGSAEQIVSSHMLEHLEDPGAALREWHRALAPGGEVLVAVPDVSREPEWIGAHLATLRARGGNALEEHYGAGFTKESLKAVLREAGFVEVVDVDPEMRWELPGKADWQACASGRKARAL